MDDGSVPEEESEDLDQGCPTRFWVIIYALITSKTCVRLTIAVEPPLARCGDILVTGRPDNDLLTESGHQTCCGAG